MLESNDVDILEHFPTKRNQPAPLPTTRYGRNPAGGWEGERAGGDFIRSKNALDAEKPIATFAGPASCPS